MGKLTLAVAAVLAVSAPPAWSQDGAQPAAPVENASPADNAAQPPAPAQENAQPPEPPENAAQPTVPSRYSFNRVSDGFLRLDSVSGQVAFCSAHTVGWACEAVAEDRAALEKEIARLQGEVTTLKQEVASLRAPPPPRPPADLTPPGKDNSAQLREDLARARAAIESAWQRLVEMIVTFQKDMMRKG